MNIFVIKKNLKLFYFSNKKPINIHIFKKSTFDPFVQLEIDKKVVLLKVLIM